MPVSIMHSRIDVVPTVIVVVVVSIVVVVVVVLIVAGSNARSYYCAVKLCKSEPQFRIQWNGLTSSYIFQLSHISIKIPEQ